MGRLFSYLPWAENNFVSIYGSGPHFPYNLNRKQFTCVYEFIWSIDFLVFTIKSLILFTLKRIVLMVLTYRENRK